LGALDVKLTHDDLRAITDALSKLVVHGARYPDHLEQLTDR